MVAHAINSCCTSISKVSNTLMTAHESSSHCLWPLKDDRMIVDANGLHDEEGRAQSHRDHHDDPMTPRGSQRQYIL